MTLMLLALPQPAIVLDPAGTILAVNPALARLIGRSGNSLTGRSLSSSAVAALAFAGLYLQFVRCGSANRQGVYFLAYQCTQTLVYELVPGQWPLARKNTANDQNLEMRIVVTGNPDGGIFESSLNKALYFCRVHLRHSSCITPGRAVYPESAGLPNAVG